MKFCTKNLPSFWAVIHGKNEQFLYTDRILDNVYKLVFETLVNNLIAFLPPNLLYYKCDVAIKN